MAEYDDNELAAFYCEIDKRLGPLARMGGAILKKGTVLRQADYMDAASFHPYQFSGKFSGAVFKEKVQEMHDAFASVGKPDMPLYVTEMGIAAYPEGGLWPDEYGAAAQNIQLWTITEAEQLVDSLYAFHFINPIPATLWENAASQENRWGFINHENERVPYSARPAGIAAAAFNKLVCNAEMKNKYINTVDDEVYMEDSQDNNNENEENEENEEKDDSEEDSEIFKNMKNVNYSERNRKNRNIKLIKNFKTEEESDEEDNANKKDKNKNANKEKNNIIIEFRLRNLLFRKKKPVRRNKSSEKRKRVGFNIDD